MKVMICLATGLLGFVLGWVITAASALEVGELSGVSHFDGAYAMGAIFLMGPMGGLFGAIVGAWLGWRWAGGMKRTQ